MSVLWHCGDRHGGRHTLVMLNIMAILLAQGAATTTTDPSTGVTTANPSSSTPTGSPSQGGADGPVLGPIAYAAIAAGVVIICIVLAVCYTVRKHRRSPHEVEVLELGSTSSRPRMLMEQWIPAHAEGFVPCPGTLPELLEELTNDNYLKINRKRVKVLESLGSGSFTVVHRALYEEFAGQDPPMQVAVKALLKEASEQAEVKLIQEGVILAQFGHPNVLSLVGILTQSGRPSLVTEFLARGPLDRYLRRARPDLPMMLGFARDICTGLNYLSTCSFVVGDLAARKVLVADDFSCRIAALGLSRDMSDDTNSVHALNVPWAAQELLPDQAGTQQSNDSGLGFQGLSSQDMSGLGFSTEDLADSQPRYTKQSDVWSFGVLLFEIWSHGELPFSKFSDDKIISEVRKGYRLPPPSNCPREVYRAMIKCWHPDPLCRPEFSDLRVIFRADPSSFKTVHPTDYPDLHETYLNADVLERPGSPEVAAPDSPLIRREIQNIRSRPSSDNWLDSTRSTVHAPESKFVDQGQDSTSTDAKPRDVPAFVRDIFQPETEQEASEPPPKVIAREEDAYITIVPKGHMTIPRVRAQGNSRPDPSRPKSMVMDSEGSYMTLADANAAKQLLKNADLEFDSGTPLALTRLADSIDFIDDVKPPPTSPNRAQNNSVNAFRRHLSDPVKRRSSLGKMEDSDVDLQLSEAERAPPGTELPVKEREVQEKQKTAAEKRRPKAAKKKWFSLSGFGTKAPTPTSSLSSSRRDSLAMEEENHDA